MKEGKLKPVIFSQGANGFFRKNEYAQNLVLKAMKDGVTDVNDIKKMVGMRTAAEVYRTLDKLAIHDEYKKSLADAGISLDYITKGIKDLVDGSKSDSIKLDGLKTLMKSVGIDSYKESEHAGQDWEELLLQTSEKKSEESPIEITDYEVSTPEVPEEEKKRHKDEKELADSLYE